MPSITTAPNAKPIAVLAAYDLSTVYTFRILATNKEGFEKLFTVKTQGDRFVNVVTAFRALPEAKGWSIYESWEVPNEMAEIPVAA